MKVVAISVDEPEASVNFAREGHIGFPLLRDADLAVAKAYGVAMKDGELAIPATFIVTRSGNIHYRKVGETQADRADFDEVLGELDVLLNSGAP